MGFKWENGRGLTELVDEWAEELPHVARRIAERVEERFLELVRDFTPMSDDPFRQFPGRLPGTLKRSWEAETELLSEGRLRVTVETHDPVAPHVEYPTRPHIIRPRPERAAAAAAEGRVAMLRFYDRDTGRVVFRHEVHHPGTAGAYMMHRALIELAAEWQRIAREEIEAWSSGRSRARLGPSRVRAAASLRRTLRERG